MSTESMDPQDRTQKKPEAKFAEQLIYALNYIKMQMGMYPKGHSMVSQGLDNLLDVLQEIFALKGQITINVEDDDLYVSEVILDMKNRNHKQFAKWLNDLFITSITLSRGLTRDELLKFQEILAMKTSDILALGNIEKVFAGTFIAHIKVKGLDLGNFTSTPEKMTYRENLKDKKPTVKGPNISHFSIKDEKITDRGKAEDKKPNVPGFDSRYFRSASEKIADRESLEDKKPKAKDPDVNHFRSTDEMISDREELGYKKQLEDELWRKFTSSLITQSNDKGEQKSRSPEYSNIDSHDFVKRLNEETIDWGVFLADYRSMIIQYLRSDDEEKKPTVENIISRIDSLVKDFHPQLKQQILLVTEKELSSLPPSIINSNKINCFNYETIAGILRGASDEKRGISPSLTLLFQKLSTIHGQSPDDSGKDVLNGSSPISETFTSAKEIEKLIEREQYESYVPADYKEILRRKTMVVEVDDKINKENFIIEEYVNTIEDPSLNLQIGKLFIALMDEELREDEYREISIYITKNISELILSGHFSLLIDILDTYKRHSQEKPSEKIRRLADSGKTVFHDTETLSRDLKPLFVQGISLESLVGFVVACGAQHIPWLLDLYLETRSPKGQAMIVEVLRHFREEAVSNVLNRLSEPSIQFIKKLLILLQLIGDAEVIPYVRTFADHPDITLRLEAITTLLRFKDHDAKALLQKAVFSTNRSESTQAIVLACEYKITDICVKLIPMIRTNIILKKDLTFNELIITEIVKTRDPQITQYLEKVAETRWSLFPGRLSRTKMALLNAIDLYAPPNAVKLIKICLNSKNKEIKTSCEELMKRESE
ncbi:MAG: HEAT repeat domain-containing protein [Syntrophus sp. (in: bacteria)]